MSSIPSPVQAVWFIGPIPVRAYALCILAGIVVAMWWTGRRLAARGQDRDAILDISMWAVPFGIIGGRLYHVISSPQAYFGPGGDPWAALRIWEGGLGIWGAVALGAAGAWIGCRLTGVPLLTLADAVAPALPVAQAIGRLGNWFNNELYGAPTDLPWGLTIHFWNMRAGRAVTGADGEPIVLGIFHPAFLYEALWCLVLSAVIVLVQRRFRTAPGQLFALYLMGYTLGRVWIEMLRIDAASIVLGLRLNVWTSIVVFAFGAGWWWYLGRRHRRITGQSGPAEEDTPAGQASGASGTSPAGSAAVAAQPAADEPGDAAGPGPARPGSPAS